jgi:ABC-2 family transporter protein
MTTMTPAPYRSAHEPGPDGISQLLRAEWTKFRTVRGWAIALVAAAVLAALATIFIAGSANGTGNPGAQNPGPTDASGQAVTDQFTFVHQPLAGNGSITVAVTSLTGQILQSPFGGQNPAGVPSLQPWSKAGLIIKASTRPGSAYAAVMVTGQHGVRMQYDYTHDIAGRAGPPSASSPAWLRLTRSGDTVTGYDSTDGKHWTQIGTATLAGLPSTVQAGLFATSPQVFVAQQGLANNNGVQLSTAATAKFDNLSRQGNWPAASWSGTIVGAAGNTVRKVSACGGRCARLVPAQNPGGYRGAGDTFTVKGSGDIAPHVSILDPLGLSFKGTLVGLIAVIALGALFITTEFRRGMMIRTTFAASPRRGRVLVAKAVVIGAVTFAGGLIGAAVAFVVGQSKLSANGWSKAVFPVESLFSAHGLTMVLGTAGIFALAAVLAMAAGAVIRRSAGAIAAVIGIIVVPLILATLMPQTIADWLLRLTPAAAFSVQESSLIPHQVQRACLPYNGCYPLSPWHGFTVLCIWAVLAVAGAAYLIRGRDA